MATAIRMILQATHTHLYPGHRGKISGLAYLADLEEGRDCLVEFSDGSATTARISAAANDWRLDTRAYRTAAGTNIPDRHWFLRLHGTGGEFEFRILRKATEN